VCQTGQDGRRSSGRWYVLARPCWASARRSRRGSAKAIDRACGGIRLLVDSIVNERRRCVAADDPP